MYGEHSDSMVEWLTWDQWAAGSSLTGVTALCPWARHNNPSLVLVQPRKTRSFVTVRLLMRRKESNQTNPQGIQIGRVVTSSNAYGQPLLKLLSSNLFSPPSLYFLSVFDCKDMVHTERLILAFSVDPPLPKSISHLLNRTWENKDPNQPAHTAFKELCPSVWGELWTYTKI